MTKNIDAIHNADLKALLKNFISALASQCSENLQSVILYGGAAKNDYIFGKSNTNVLLVFEKMDIDTLDSLCVIFQKGMADFKLSPFILTSSEISPASDVFAVKLFDIKQHNVLLYGNEVLNAIDFEPRHLQFISEQDLRNQLARMKFFYIKNFNLPEQLLLQVKKSYTTLLINANMLLFLRKGVYFGTREEIISNLLKESDTDASILNELQKARTGSLDLNPENIKYLYDKLMLQYKLLIDAFKKLKPNA